MFSLTKIIFTTLLNVMKQILDLAKFKLTEQEFIYFKKMTMDVIYNSTKQLFHTMECKKIVEKCECKANVRQGYSDCAKCGGSGFKEIEKKEENV